MRHATILLLTLLTFTQFACFDYGNQQIEKTVKLIRKDSKKAEQQFIQLAKKGNPDAQAWIGFMVLSNQTMVNHIISQEYNSDLAKPWLDKSIEGNSSLGYFYRGIIDDKSYDYSISNPYLEKAAAQQYSPALLEVNAEQLQRIPTSYPFNLRIVATPDRNCNGKIGIDATHCQFMKANPLPQTNRKAQRKAFKQSVATTKHTVTQRFYRDLQRISERLQQKTVPYSEEKILFNRVYMYNNHGPNNPLLKAFMATPKAKLLMGKIFANMQYEWLGKGRIVKRLAAECFLEVLQVTRNTEHIQLYEQTRSALKSLIDNGYSNAKHLLKTY